MKIASPKICLGQINVESKNPHLNFSRMEDIIKKSILEKYDLVIFSELCLPGYFNGDWWESTANLIECEKYHQKIAKLSKHIDILFGSVGIDWKHKNEDGRVRKYNAAFLASHGKFLRNKKTKFSFWPKTLLPQYREFDDSRHFFDLRRLAYEKKCRVQDLYEPITLKYHRKRYHIGITICEDIWDENYSLSLVKLFSKKYKHDLFVNLSASPFSLGKTQKRHSLLKEHAKTAKTNFIYVNCVGTQNIGKTIYTFDGSSQVYTKHGELLVKGKFCEEDFISLSQAAAQSCPPHKIHQDMESFESTAQILLEAALRHTCQKWNIQKVVVGLSGGIDSALSSVLLTRALGAENVYLINLPTQFNSQVTQDAAQKLAKNLNCPFAIVPINQVVNDKKTKINSIVFQQNKESVHVKLSQLNFENIQARERGAGILAAIASSLNAVFVCNTNKSEMTVGYGTLYGDIAGFLCPLGDLWKHQIYALARYYNMRVFKKEIIPKEIFDLPPSAELSKEQDVLNGKGDPLIYDYHDYLFAAWIEQWDRKTLKDCLDAYQNDTIDNLLKLPYGKTKQFFKNFEQFKKDAQQWWSLFTTLGAIKRVQAPPVLAISRRAFGFDYRESI